MREFICTCDWMFIVGRKRVFGPVFKAPGEHQAYWHVGRMMTRKQFKDQYGDCAARFAAQAGTIR